MKPDSNSSRRDSRLPGPSTPGRVPAFVVFSVLVLCLSAGTALAQIVVQNMSFEENGSDFANPPQGWSTWVTSGSLDGTLTPSSRPEFSWQALDYDYAAGRIANGQTYDGGYYQQVPAVPGHRYHCTAYLSTPTSGVNPGEARLGIDLSGGVNPQSGTVIWTGWASSPTTWTKIGFEFEAAPTATGSAMTLFLHLRQTNASPWNAVLLDYVAVYDVSRAELPVEHIWGWVPPGGRLGDDRGPAEQVKLANELYYDTFEGSGARGEWGPCEPSPGVWNWASVDTAGSTRQALVDKGSVLISGLWFGTTSWTPAYDTPLYWFYAERFVTEMAKRANMWGTYAWVFENEPEGKGDVSGHGARLRHAFSGLKAASVNNIVIAPNISGAGWDWYSNLYNNYSLKYSTDVIGSHQYSGDPNAGVSVGGVVSMHNIMAAYNDGDKRIWLGEGWAPYAALADVFRANHYEWLNAREVDAIRRTVVNGYLNMTTNEMTGSHNPDWLWGASFFTMNDWYNKYGWRARAVPVDEDGDGEVDYYTVDGYRVGLDIDPGFNPTGLTDFRGNSKDDIMDVYPGNNLSLANPGFELEWSIEEPYAWVRRTETPAAEAYIVDRSIRRHGRRSLRIQMADIGTEYVTQSSAKYSIAAGETHTAAAWVRTWGVSGGGRGASVRLRYLNTAGDPAGPDAWSPSAPGNSDWTRLEATGAAPAGAVRVEVGLFLDGVGGIAWFDDVSVNHGSAVALSTIRGVVVDDWYNSEPGALVTVGAGEYTGTTGADGNYVIENVVPGTYDIVAAKPGFGSEESRDQIAPAGRERVTSFSIPALSSRMPVDLQALDLKTGGMIDVSWRNPTHPEFQYVNLYTTDIPSQPGSLLAGSLAGESYLLTGITPGDRHYLYLRAVHGDIGESDPTEVVLGKTTYGKESVFYQVGSRADWGPQYTNDWGQTFTAVEDYDLAYVSCMIGTAGTGKRTMYVSIRDGGPAGAQIGPTRSASMYSDETRRFFWGEGEVPLETGHVYYVHYYSPDGGFGMYRNAANPYPGGMTFTNGNPETGIDIWSTMAGAYPPDIEISGVTAEAAGGGYVTVRWKTKVPGTSQVEYGRTASLGSLSPVDPAAVRDHEILLQGLDLNATYHYRVRSTWNDAAEEVSPDYMVSTGESPETPTPRPTTTPTATLSPTPTPGPGGELLVNRSFEADGASFRNPPTGWESFGFSEDPDGTLKDGDLGMTFSAYDDTYVAGKITNWGRPDHGFSQHFPTSPGGKYECTVWIRTLLTSGGTPGRARLGFDPAGGTDPSAASVQWTAWTSASLAWVRIGFMDAGAVTATGSSATLYLHLKQDEMAPWNAVFFDLASVRQIGGLPPTATPTPTPPGTPTPIPTSTLTLTPTATPSPVPDLDGDGIPNEIEGGRFPADGETNRYLPDSDGDGLDDGVEDANHNGIHDPGELDPRSRDSDGDGYEDGVEAILLGTDPLDPQDPAAAVIDSDGDGLPFGLDPNDTLVDTDGDRFTDGYEAVTLGLLAAETAETRPDLGDVDGDGAVDADDAGMVFRFFSGFGDAGFDYRRADANRDGRIDNADAQYVLNFADEVQPVLPVE